MEVVQDVLEGLVDVGRGDLGEGLGDGGLWV